MPVKGFNKNFGRITFGRVSAGVVFARKQVPTSIIKEQEALRSVTFAEGY
jgi:hypothetical protein